MALGERRVLVVDDEPKITEAVGTYLPAAGYVPISAGDWAAALSLFDDSHFCLVVLDLMLPDTSGEKVCRGIRARSRVPVIMLTAKVEDADAIHGFSIGADDHVIKPFSPRQLMARVDAVLRRTEGRGSPPARSLSFSRDELIARVLGDDFDGFDRTVDAHVKNLRQKIEADPRSPCYIVTVHGQGYASTAAASHEPAAPPHPLVRPRSRPLPPARDRRRERGSRVDIPIVGARGDGEKAA